jgi:nucleoside recognition membrane protein YjiH
MLLAIINGILTSILLETVILARQMPLNLALKTAAGMSLISMVAMEAAMNLVDVAITGGAKLTLFVVPIMLLAGFLAPLPYNYWRLKALGKSCH